MIVGAFLGMFITKSESFKIDSKKFQVTLPGTYSVLAIFISLFIIKYIFGVLELSQPLAAQHYAWIKFMITGLCSGYFFGKLLTYYQAIKKDRN